MKHRKKSSFVIAIDGPSGSGKGTLSRKLGAFYDFAVLDTGLLYRAVGVKMLSLDLDLTSPSEAKRAAQEISLQDPLHEENRGDKAASAASQIAGIPEVREVLNQYQRDFASSPPDGKKGVILDGRDIGTSICPDAGVKLYLEANDEIRAQRRYEELQFRGITGIYADVLRDIRLRDKRDKERQTSPLRPAEDAVILDTSTMDSEDVFLKARDIIESNLLFKAWRKAL